MMYQPHHRFNTYAFTRLMVIAGCLLLLVGLSGCGDQEAQARENAIRRSIRNYWNALDLRTEEALRTYVYFPDVIGYRKHVSDLILKYLEDAQEKGKITFDEQGVVISRFLRFQHLNYKLLSLSISDDQMNAKAQIAFHFSYDSLLDQTDYEDGTKVFMPVEPLGTVETLIAGEANNTPRNQLAYLELEVELRKTNFEDYWQVRRMEPIPDSARYDVSLKDRF